MDLALIFELNRTNTDSFFYKKLFLFNTRKSLTDIYLFIYSSLESRHLLYLQLRKSILESYILCSDDDLISLGGLALQSEIGDFKQSVFKAN